MSELELAERALTKARRVRYTCIAAAFLSGFGLAWDLMRPIVLWLGPERAPAALVRFVTPEPLLDAGGPQ